MSTASLPSYYLVPNLPQTPAYTQEPQEDEQRLVFSDRHRPRPSGVFVKQSKNGEIRLTLNVQDGQIPVYNSGGIVDGTLHIAKTESVSKVEVKIEGRLQVKEIAEGGTVDRKVCITSAQLWSEEMGVSCPNSCRFQLTLPTKFDLEGQPYTLPPTYSVKLSTVPGFTAFIEYSLSAVISKSNLRAPLGSLVKASFLGIGNTTLSTPFIYVPRTRPAAALPAPLQLSRVGGGFDGRPEWQIHESTINSRRSSLQNIKARLYIPASRIFCVSQNIPFHLTLESSALSLATFLPFGPTGNSTKKCTRLQIMRQVTVDARNKMILGTKTDMWRVDCLGEATAFKHAGDGATWTSFTGEVSVDPSMKVMGFKVGGITVKDCILFSVTSPRALKAPFDELRQVIPIRLTTDAWEGTDLRSASECSVLSSPDSSAE